MDTKANDRTRAHDLLQPLGVIKLTTGGVRKRIVPGLGAAEAEYLATKLARIEHQVDRLAELIREGSSEMSPDIIRTVRE